MEYRTIKDVKPSLLGLGCMRLPLLRAGQDDVDPAAAQPIVDAAIAGGVTYFDTAYAYHNKTSEKFTGAALKQYPRESFFLATKMPLWAVETLDDAKRIFAEQLANCQVDYFDFYLFHAIARERFDAMEAIGLYDFLAEQKEKGIIKHLGFSFHDTPEVLADVCAAHQWDFAQIQLNYLDFEMQRAGEQYDILMRHGIPCVVMEPVRGGALADLGPEANAVLQAANPGASIASWALRWVASLPGVFTILSGMGTLAQLADNIAAFSPFTPLTEAERTALDEALAIYKKTKFIPCTGCRYCMDCPAGVDIPLAFRTANRFASDKNLEAFKADMEQARPDACIACGLCLDKCPQGIAIPDKMENFCTMLR